MTNLLFLNVGRRGELVELFRDTLNKVGGGIIYGSDISPLAPALNIVDRPHIFPKGDDPKFGPFLLQFCRSHQIDLVIPTIDPDLVRLNRLRQQFKKELPHCRLLIPCSFTIDMSQDKRLTKELFEKLGFTVPDTISDKEKNESYPLFVKPPQGSAGRGARKITSRIELEKALESTPDLMIERIVQGPEYTIDVLSDFTGTPLIAIPRKRLKTRGGEVTQGVIERNNQLEDLAKRVAEGFNATGPITVQFRKTPDGKFVAMEVNARMGGGLPLSIAAGADWPGWIISLHQKELINVNVPITNGLILSRCDRSFFLTPDHLTALTNSKNGFGKTDQARKTLTFSDKKGWIFDLDDTLFPELDFIFSGYRAVSEKVYNDFKVDIENDLRTRFLRGERGDLFSPCLKSNDVYTGELYVKGLVFLYRNHKPRIIPFVEAIPFLQFLQGKRKKIGLVSDGWFKVQQRKLKALKINHFFDAIVFTDKLGGKKSWKPSTKGYQECLTQLSLKPTECVYIGDNPTKDFLGANSMGITTVRLRKSSGEYFNNHAKTPEHEADLTISQLNELQIYCTA